jgi:hypothetical protein
MSALRGDPSGMGKGDGRRIVWKLPKMRIVSRDTIANLKLTHYRAAGSLQ